MKRFLRFGTSAGLLGLSPILISVATFVSVPIILGTLGPQIWVSITIGQAIGEIARALVVWGWNSIGITIVAPMSPAEKLRYYFASILPRVMIFVVVAVAITIGSFAIPSADPGSALRMSFAGAIYGLTGGWLLISNGEPLKFVLFDALPRAASILIASLLLLAIPSPAIYGWVNIVGSLLAVCLPFALAARRAKPNGVKIALGTFREAIAALRRGLPIVGSVLVMVMRISFSVLAAPFIAPSATPTVALGDKFFRWANTAMTPIMQTLLARIPRLGGGIRRRARLALILAWSGGLILGIVTVFVVRYLSGPLSHGQIVIPFASAIPIGIAAMMVFVAGITGNSVLVMFGRLNQVFSAGLVALVLLVASSVSLGLLFGASGMFWAFAIAESVVVIYQSFVVAAELRRAPVETSKAHDADN